MATNGSGRASGFGRRRTLSATSCWRTSTTPNTDSPINADDGHGRPFIRARSQPIHWPSLSRHSSSFAPPTSVKSTARQQHQPQPRHLFRRDATRPIAHTFGRGQHTGSPSATKASRDVYREAFLWHQFLSARPCTAFTWFALPWPALPLPGGLTASGECRLTCTRNRAKHEWRHVIQGPHVSI